MKSFDKITDDRHTNEETLKLDGYISLIEKVAKIEKRPDKTLPDDWTSCMVGVMLRQTNKVKVEGQADLTEQTKVL